MTPSPINFATDRLLITGGQGFLGKHLRRALLERGADESRLFCPSHAEYELTDEAQVRRLYEQVQPDVVFHLAAEVGGIGANAAHPGRFFYANFAMGLHMIEFGRRHGLKKFLHCGTVCAYPKHARMPFTEDQFWESYPAEPTAPYGIAKLSLNVMLDGYAREYGLPSATVIPVNLYGPGDDFDLHNAHVVAALVRKFVAAAERDDPEVIVWGSGRASREFLHVRDAAEGLVAAAERVAESTPINLGSGIETPIAELTQVIAAETGFTGRIVWDDEKPDGQPRRCLSMDRSHALLDWSAQIPLAEGIRETVAWYRQHRSQFGPTAQA